MFNDKFSNTIYQTQDIINYIYCEKDINLITVEPTQDVIKFEEQSKIVLNKFYNDKNITIKEFDALCQQQWLIPEEYKNLDIENYLFEICPQKNRQRLAEELQEYKSRNIMNLLNALKYLVDSFRKHDVLWGVGRGSSVSSYVLFLIGVHKIDSVKYQLDYREFFK